jgi:hypothetical protein
VDPDLLVGFADVLNSKPAAKVLALAEDYVGGPVKALIAEYIGGATRRLAQKNRTREQLQATDDETRLILAKRAAKVARKPPRQLPSGSPEVIEVEAEIVVDVEEAEFAQFDQTMMSRQGAKKGHNFLSVTAQAIGELPPRVSDEPVDEDIASRIFTNIQDVSNEQMQKLWAKLLAGEITKPGSFSVRTLDVLKNLSPKEAAVFERDAPIIERATFSIFYGNESPMSPGALEVLVDAGLMLPPGGGMSFGGKTRLTFPGYQIMVAPIPGSTRQNFDGRPIIMNAARLTRAGRELLAVVGLRSDKSRLEQLITDLRAHRYTAELAES